MNQESVSDVDSPDLESVMHLIWDRIETLEAERRRLRRGAAVFASGVLAFAVLWTGFPTHTQTSGPITLRDDHGRIRASVETDPESGRTTLQLVDASGAPQAVLGSDVAGPMLTFYDRQGSARVRIGLEEGSEDPIIDVVDKTNDTQSSVNLVALRDAKTVAPATADPVVRRISVRGSTARYAPRSRENYSTCAPGVLGCSRISRVERSDGRG